MQSRCAACLPPTWGSGCPGEGDSPPKSLPVAENLRDLQEPRLLLALVSPGHRGPGSLRDERGGAGGREEDGGRRHRQGELGHLRENQKEPEARLLKCTCRRRAGGWGPRRGRPRPAVQRGGSQYTDFGVSQGVAASRNEIRGSPLLCGGFHTPGMRFISRFGGGLGSPSWGGALVTRPRR